MEQKATEILGAIQKAVEAGAPQALDLTLRSIQFNAAFTLIVTGTCLLLWLLVSLWGVRHTSKVIRACTTGADGLEGYDELPAVIGAVLYGTGTLIVLITTVNLLDAQVWMTAIDPRLGLANKIVEKFLN